MPRAPMMDNLESTYDTTGSKPHRSDHDGVFPLMRDQYHDLISRRRVEDGERRLLFAVLEDAIRTYAMCLNSKSPTRQREFAEVKLWIHLRSEHSVFSFDSLCLLFEIDPDLLRKQLAAMKTSGLPHRRIGSIGRRVPIGAAGI